MLSINNNHIVEGPGLIHQIMRYKAATPADYIPRGITWHYSCTAPGTGLSMANRLARNLDPHGSCHFFIESDGAIIQCAPMNIHTWHANSKTARQFSKIDADRMGANRARFPASANAMSVGIELVNWGKMTGVPRKTERSLEQFAPWPGPDKTRVRISGANVKRVDGGSCWAMYPEPQLEAALRLGTLIAAHYKMVAEFTMLEHSKLDPSRRDDPGPLLADVIGRVGASVK
jgi:N-acetyl-anhydromuramyl-L-alanine amidase AmpD